MTATGTPAIQQPRIEVSLPSGPASPPRGEMPARRHRPGAGQPHAAPRECAPGRVYALSD
jgi:hypothetical protein